MTTMAHIPRQREDGDYGGTHPGFPHKVTVKLGNHGPHAPKRYRCFCVACHTWWWAPVPDPTFAGWETAMWAASRHVLYGSWPTDEELDANEAEEV